MNKEEPMNISPAKPIPQADTGEEAYLRRLQMSRPRAPSPPVIQPPTKPSFVTAAHNVPVPSIPPPASSHPVPTIPTAFTSNDEMDEEIPALVPPPAQVAPTQLSQAAIEERKKAAAAIAARLSALSKLSAAVEPPKPVPPPLES